MIVNIVFFTLLCGGTLVLFSKFRKDQLMFEQRLEDGLYVQMSDMLQPHLNQEGQQNRQAPGNLIQMD